MTESQILDWAAVSPLGHMMKQVPPLFSICETLHFIGLCLLLGGLLVIDLRVLGFMKKIPMAMAVKFVPVAILGLSINVVTGILFFFSNPLGYWSNWMFKLKLVLVLFAGLNALYFSFVEQKRLLVLTGDASADRRARLSAGASLVLWCLVLIAGRLLPVTQTFGNG